MLFIGSGQHKAARDTGKSEEEHHPADQRDLQADLYVHAVLEHQDALQYKHRREHDDRNRHQNDQGPLLYPLCYICAEDQVARDQNECTELCQDIDHKIHHDSRMSGAQTFEYRRNVEQSHGKQQNQAGDQQYRMSDPNGVFFRKIKICRDGEQQIENDTDHPAEPAHVIEDRQNDLIGCEECKC